MEDNKVSTYTMIGKSPWYDEAFMVLKEHAFQHMDVYVLKLILKCSTILHLSAGDTLFSQGDNPDYAYIILRGRLSAQLPSQQELEYVPMVFFSRGAILGEIGVITDTDRSMHILANRDAILLRIHGKLFKEIYTKYIITNNAQLRAIYLNQLNRNKKLFASAKKSISYSVSTVISFNADDELENILSILSQEDSVEKKLFTINITELNTDKLSVHIAELEAQHKHLIIFVSSSYTESINELLDLSDRVVILAHGSDAPGNTEIMRDFLSKNNLYNYNINTVLLVHQNSNSQNNASQWLELKSSLRIINYFKGDDTAPSRIYRYFCNSLIGVVLSGAGYRGLAYVGVLKALTEYGVPIDVIGGTSMGAVIGACFIVSKTFEEFNQLITTVDKDIHNTFSWKEIIFSFSSVFSGKSSLHIANLFNAFKIEELRLPFFCVSCNLSTKRETHHFHGRLGDVLRASSAIPGLLPPMVLDGSLFVDGVVVNNTPVDVMLSITTHEGTIITIDLSQIELLSSDYVPVNIPTFFERVKTFFVKKAPQNQPDFRKILLTSFLMHGESKESVNTSLSTVYIKPDMGNHSFLPATHSALNELIRIGYDATVDAIKDHPQLKRYCKK